MLDPTRLALLTAGAICFAPVPASAQKDQILEAAEAVFAAIGSKDTAALRNLVHPAAHLYATQEGADSVTVRVSTRDQFLAQVAGSKSALLERMWNAEVKVSGPLAIIWTPYDFHVDRQWSHCGIDTFQMVKSATGWQVLTIAYTIVRPAERCKASPLGKP